MSDRKQEGALLSETSAVPPRIMPSEIGKTALWPVVVGILGILLAVLATIGGATELLAEYVPGMEGLKDETTRQFENSLRWQSGFLSVVEVILQVALIVVLWFAAVGVLTRRRWGVTAARIYAIGGLVYLLATVAALFANWGAFQEFMDEASAGVATPLPIKGVMMFAMVIGFLWQLIICVGILAWFGSGRARREWANW